MLPILLLKKKKSSFIFAKNLVEPPNSQYFSVLKIVLFLFFFSKYRFFCGQILSRHQTTFVQQPVKNLQRSAPFVSEHCSPSHVTDWQPWRVKQALRLGSGCLPSTLMAPGSSHSSHLYTGTLLLLLLAHAFSLSSPEGNRTQHLRGKRHTGQLVSALVFFPTLRAESH